MMGSIKKKMTGMCVIACIAAIVFLHVKCSNDTLFDPAGKKWNAPFAFVTDADYAMVALNDTGVLHLTDSITVAKNSPVTCIGLVSNPRRQLRLQGKWTFGDGQTNSAVFDSSFIVKHTFADTGLYRAIFSIEDDIGDIAVDNATIRVVTTVNTKMVSIELRSPANNITKIDPAEQLGVLFSWQISKSDPNDAITADVYLGEDSQNLKPIATNVDSSSISLTSLKYAAKYYWCVVVNRASVIAARSPVFTFSTRPKPTAVGPFIDSIRGDTTVRAGDSIRFFAFVTDSGSSITQYAWSFYGDTVYQFKNGTSADCKFAYPDTGRYFAVFKATDLNDRSVFDTVHIIVIAAHPAIGPDIVSIRSDTTVTVHDPVSFYALVKDSGSLVTSYAWDFNGNGNQDYSDSLSASCTHIFSNTGVYNSKLTVTDKNGKSASQTVTITVIPVNSSGGPVIRSIRNDTTVTVGDTMAFFDSVTDADAALTGYAWDFDGNGTYDDSSTSNIIFKHAYQDVRPFKPVLRITDANGNTAYDTIRITVEKIKLHEAFISPDTTVDFGNIVQCFVTVGNQIKNLSFEIDTMRTGFYKPMNISAAGFSASYVFKADTAAIVDSVKIRVFALLTDTLITGFKVNIRPRPLTITGIDSGYSTITVHWTKTLESSFQEYQIYRNTSPAVDTTSNLWATITQAGTVLYTPVPSYALLPRYYRIYQKDIHGLLSAGSNIVFGTIKNSPPSKPVFVNPSNPNDTIWSNAVVRWNSCGDSNSDAVTYDVLLNRNYAGYVLFASGITDTFVKLKGFDSLSQRANIMIIARDSHGAGDSSELTNIILRQARSGRMCVVPRGSFIDSLGNIATLTYDYLMDSIEVTQLSFKTVMNGFNPSNNIDDKKPVENVTWYQAIMYCNALSKMLNLDTAYRFNSISAQNAFNLQPNLNVKAVRLPTEDEWEMAAHAGKNLLFATDDGLLSCGQANYGLCNVNSTKYAGSYPANPYGIHDMTGNVLEWCWDVFNDQRFSRVDYANSAAGGFAGSMRVQRGGDYQETNTGRLQNNSRRGANPTNTNSRIGFRCVIPLKQ